ncbi:hypothetical protein SPBR_01967 [Sporothrix brasiliensis 5110]|uniref:Uncharacterized protein n=1 Tax=Sporothrix brasiliensis 5110 TaxID=1398154 RepID=A0A0C2ISE3_9PEZI|nr:uncharacterized protein SPBR_01967 [Sporothrix brasiliensis 5110]KIH91951.1 hypothetical protein SPBR_01967 [Sporothrix brasiliensis 5110]
MDHRTHRTFRDDGRVNANDEVMEDFASTSALKSHFFEANEHAHSSDLVSTTSFANAQELDALIHTTPTNSRQADTERIPTGFQASFYGAMELDGLLPNSNEKLDNTPASTPTTDAVASVHSAFSASFMGNDELQTRMDVDESLSYHEDSENINQLISEADDAALAVPAAAGSTTTTHSQSSVAVSQGHAPGKGLLTPVALDLNRYNDNITAIKHATA